MLGAILSFEPVKHAVLLPYSSKVLGTFAPEERKFHGTKVIGLFAPRERMFHGAKVLSMDFSLPGNESAEERKGQVPWYILYT